MKKAILIAMAVWALSAAPATAAENGVNLLLTGGPEANTISIALSPDGRTYTISSVVPLEVGGDICTHPEEKPNELACEAAAIASFEVNAGAGDDSVQVASKVPVPVTLRGGPGNDRLSGGAGSDRLIGGAGEDVLVGRGGDDWLYGGPGDDRLYGGAGDDVLHGGPGRNTMVGGGGNNHVSLTASAR